MNQRKLITIVCPVYNEEACVPIFYERLQTALRPMRERYDFELLFTNNRSTDGTLPSIMKLRERDGSVQVLTLSRNFGYEASIATGLRHAHGDAIIAIDVDCEDPPEMLPEFIADWERGFDVVYGKRDHRMEFVGMHWARKAFYRLTHLIADSDFVIDMAEFYLISARVRDAMLSNRSTKPFLRSEVGYTGFERKGISYTRQPRAAGKTHYNLFRATEFAVAGILTTSTFPLRLPLYLFPLLVIANAALLAMDRFKTLVTVDLLFIALFMAMISLYLARTYKDVDQRPLTVVDWSRSAVNKSATLPCQSQAI